MLRFTDGTQVRVTGLNEVMAHLYTEGRQANRETAEEIVNRLEEQKNFIPSSHSARREYARVLLVEYAEYLKGRENQNK